MDDHDLKKLFATGLIHSGMPTDEPAPMTPKEERELFNRFAEPNHPDVFTCVIRRNNHRPGYLFSKKPLGKLLHTLRLFVGGRILGNYDKTKKEPEVMIVTVQVDHMTLEQFKELTKDDDLKS